MRAEDLAGRNELNINDIVVSRVEEGHLLWIVTAVPSDRIALAYRGDGWNVQYAVARGAKLAERKGGTLWYTTDDAATLEYLESFRSNRSLTPVH